MSIATATATAEADIRKLIDDWVKANRVKDIDAIMAAYAPDVLAFDAVGQLQFKGAEAYRHHWQACLSFMEGPMIFEVHELEIAAQDDVAFCHYLARCGGTGPDGKEQSGWTRATVCLRRAGGVWRVVHEHFSAPFDLESGKALLELRP